MCYTLQHFVFICAIIDVRYRGYCTIHKNVLFIVVKENAVREERHISLFFHGVSLSGPS